MDKITKCIYCSSTSHGRPCLFSPTNTHVHMGDSEKCIYCGSKYLGSGCMFNPYSKFHVRGPEFLSKVREQVEKTTVLNYLLENLNMENDLNYKSSLDRFYKRIVSIVSTLGQPLLEALHLSEKPTYDKLSKSQMIKTVEYKQIISEHLRKLNKTLFDANTELPRELVEEIIVDAIISNSDKSV